MKRILLFAILATAAGCHHDDPAPTDPLLGHWEGTQMRLYAYARGSFWKDTTVTGVLQLDVMRDSIRTTYFGAIQQFSYRRVGEELVTPHNMVQPTYVRNLTPTSFRFEQPVNYPPYSRRSIEFHR